MGSGSSKPASAPSAPASHVWTSETPVRFSQELVDSLQASPETDSTRAKNLELHVQKRVASELQRLQKQTEKELEDLKLKISSTQDTNENKTAGDTLRDIGREAVQNDVTELRKKLERRKKLSDVDEGVESAKSEVIRCLRENDRRPLDCYKEVEKFKEQVRRLESVWVENVIR